MAYRHWTLDDLPWAAFDASKIDPDILKIVKAASVVEYNATDYAAYLCNVFAQDAPFQAAARAWALEEVQHGEALGRWATLADPRFDFHGAFARFRQGYTVNTQADTSVRGSKSGELVARCMVETGTSSYYLALGDATNEPVLKALCARIAADELRHYKLFYNYLRGALANEDLGRFARLRIVLGRIAESEDDELAYAYYATNAAPDEPYERARFSHAYMRRAYSYYRPEQVDRVVAMILKACGFTPRSLLHRSASTMAWWIMTNRVKHLQRLAA